MPTQCIQIGTQSPQEDETNDHTTNPCPHAHSRNLVTPTERSMVDNEAQHMIWAIVANEIVKSGSTAMG